MKKVRASKTDLFFDCASSVLEPDNVHEPKYDASRLGTAVHESLAARVNGHDIELEEIADKHGIDLDDLVPLHTYGLKAWRELRSHIQEPQTELPVESDLLTGHADIIGRDGDSLIVLDWKSGWLRQHKNFQMASYAHGARAKYGMPKSGIIKTVLVWLRYGEIDVADYDNQKLDQFAQIFKKQLTSIGKHYAAGEWCAYCPKRLDCGTYHAYVRSAALTISESKEISRETLAELYSKSRLVKKAIDAYEKALRNELAHGPLALPDGKEISLASYEKATIDAVKAWPVLTKDCGFSRDDMAEVTHISKTAVEKIVNDRAPRGHKAKAKRLVIDNLKDAGAITMSGYQKIKIS